MESSSKAPFISSVKEEVDAVGAELFEYRIKNAVATAPFLMSRFTVEPGCATHEDKHAVHEIWLIAQGIPEICYESRWLRASVGDALYFAPWKPHWVRNVGSTPLLIFSGWWR